MKGYKDGKLGLDYLQQKIMLFFHNVVVVDFALFAIIMLKLLMEALVTNEEFILKKSRKLAKTKPFW